MPVGHMKRARGAPPIEESKGYRASSRGNNYLATCSYTLEVKYEHILIMTHEVGRLRRVPCLAHMAQQSAGNAPTLAMLGAGGGRCRVFET